MCAVYDFLARKCISPSVKSSLGERQTLPHPTLSGKEAWNGEAGSPSVPKRCLSHASHVSGVTFRTPQCMARASGTMGRAQMWPLRRVFKSLPWLDGCVPHICANIYVAWKWDRMGKGALGSGCRVAAMVRTGFNPILMPECLSAPRQTRESVASTCCKLGHSHILSFVFVFWPNYKMQTQTHFSVSFSERKTSCVNRKLEGNGFYLYVTRSFVDFYSNVLFRMAFQSHSPQTHKHTHSTHVYPWTV